MNSPYNNDSIELSSSEHENIIQLSGDDEDDSYYDSEDIRDAMEEMDNFNIDNTDYNNEEDDDVVELSDYNSYSDNMISDVMMVIMMMMMMMMVGGKSKSKSKSYIYRVNN